MKLKQQMLAWAKFPNTCAMMGPLSLVQFQANMDKRSVANLEETMITDGGAATKAHDLRQKLNVISLAVANLRARLAPSLCPEDRCYLVQKLDRIEQQVLRAAEILDE
ncbi:MAG: hypothetical protein ACLGHF_04895 [Alphaproteobacteria bacterium]